MVASETSLLLEWALKSEWAIHKPTLAQMGTIFARHASGIKLSADEIQAAIGGAEKKPTQIYSLSESGVATIRVHGVIAKRSSMISDVSESGGASCEKIQKAFGEAILDPHCESIILDIDSPGGCVDGLADLSDFIFGLRGTKPSTAFCSGKCCSGGYFLGSACNRIVVSQDCLVGSIGVYHILQDCSEMLENMGIKEEMIKAGKYKGLGHPDFPITSDTRKVTQATVDAHYENFVQTVARNRGMKFDAALKMADGRVWVGKDAVHMGLADEVGTFQSVGGSVKPAINPTEARSVSKLQQVPAKADEVITMPEPIQTPVQTAPMQATTSEFSPQQLAQIAGVLKPMVAEALGGVNQALEVTKKDVLSFKEQTAKDKAFAEQQVNIKAFLAMHDGKLDPCEKDATNPFGTLADELMRRDHSTPYEITCADGRKVTLTDRQIAMEKIAARPVKQITEKAKSQERTAPSGLEHDLSIIDKFADQHPDDAKCLSDDMTVQGFRVKYKEMANRIKDPEKRQNAIKQFAEKVA